MTKTPRDSQTTGVVEDRRRLLRAAATAAPLVATLPSGAAWAQASTAQCILDTQPGGSAYPGYESAVIEANIIRVLAIKQDWIVPPDSTLTTTYYLPDAAAYYEAATDPADDAGLPVNPFPDDPLPAWVLVPGQDALEPPYAGLGFGEIVYVLRMYRPDPNASTAETVVNCDGSETGTPPLCVWPVRSTNSGFQGMANSCMCSVNPGLGFDCATPPP
ncbi:MAG: hypothetical protein WBG92_20120 [Thiohalocapsa sp.]